VRWTGRNVAILLVVLTATVVVVVLGWGLVGSARAAASGTAVVPRVAGTGLLAAYDRLHAAGLRVRIPARVWFDSLAPPRVARAVPAAGRRVAPGSVVTLYLRRGVGRLRVSGGRLPKYTVPRFVGGDVSAAQSWVGSKELAFRAYLAPLTADNGLGFFANYRVTRQQPRAASRLTLGYRAIGARGRITFRVTPLTVWGRQLPRCSPPPGYTIIARSPTAAIASDTFRYDPGIGPQNYVGWYGCLRAVGWWRLLNKGEARPGYFDSLVLQHVLLAGRLVAISFLDHEGKASGCLDDVEIYDLRTGKPGDVFDDFCRPSGASSIGSLQLDSNGFAAWHTTDDHKPTEVTGMSCPSVSLCVATDGLGNVLTATNPAGGRQAWAITSVAAGGLASISCPTQNLCVAVGG
jgi:hypothetical protein